MRNVLANNANKCYVQTSDFFIFRVFYLALYQFNENYKSSHLIHISDLAPLKLGPGILRVAIVGPEKYQFRDF